MLLLGLPAAALNGLAMKVQKLIQPLTLAAQPPLQRFNLSPKVLQQA